MGGVLRVRLKWILALFLGLIILSCIVCQSIRNPFDYGPDWAPDGTALVFTCYEPSMWEASLHALGIELYVSGDVPYATHDMEICTIRSDGKRTRLTFNRVADYGQFGHLMEPRSPSSHVENWELTFML